MADHLRTEIARMIHDQEEAYGFVSGGVALAHLALSEKILEHIRAELEPMRPDPPGGPTSYGRGRIEMLDQVLEALTWSEPVD